MQTVIILLVVTQLVISAAASFAPKLKIPAPLILVLAGIGVSLVPGVPNIVIDPEIIMLGLLPPLLYASATSVPVMNFRRDFTAISCLSIVLVILTSLALGALFHRVIPGVSFGWGVALGAILSPTDAVATSILEGRGVPGRVSVLLDCEGLLNDASALIVLRTAIVATALGFSFWPTVGSFVQSIAVAFVFGKLAASLNLAIRRRVREEAVNTILSFTTPFAAALPAEHFHGSGLVAAVIAGFVTGMKAPRALPPGHRISDAQNWATVELGLEGAIFLTMGLQLATIVRQVEGESIGLGRGIGIAVGALVITLVVRGLYVGPLLRGSNRRAEKKRAHQSELQTMQDDLRAGRIPQIMADRAKRFHLPTGERAVKRVETRIRRYLADLDYLASQPLGKPETAIVVWAGMRGAVTVAAVQLLPPETPHRSLMVFVAFTVATLSLLVQGGTVGLLVGHLFREGESEATAHARHEERSRIRLLLDDVCNKIHRHDGMSTKEHRLTLLSAQRNALLDARDDGVFAAETLAIALRDVDIDEVVLELRSETIELR